MVFFNETFLNRIPLNNRHLQIAILIYLIHLWIAATISNTKRSKTFNQKYPFHHHQHSLLATHTYTV